MTPRRNIAKLHQDPYILTYKILKKRSIDAAYSLPGRTKIYFDEAKELLKIQTIAMDIAYMVSKARYENTVICIIDQDCAFVGQKDQKYSAIFKSNIQTKILLNLQPGDHLTADYLGLNNIERQTCEKLGKQNGYWSDYYLIWPLGRIKLRGYCTPISYALCTSEPADRVIRDYLYQQILATGGTSGYAYMTAPIQFSQQFPHGSEQYPGWQEMFLKNGNDPVKTYREIAGREKKEFYHAA